MDENILRVILKQAVTPIQNQLNKIARQLNDPNSGLTSINKRLNGLDSGLGTINKRLNDPDSGLEYTSRKLDSIAGDTEQLLLMKSKSTLVYH